MLEINSLFIAFIIYFFYLGLKLRSYLHSMQLNSYFNIRFLKWAVKKNLFILMKEETLLFLVCVPLVFNQLIIANILFILITLYLIFILINKKEKKRLVFTARAKRLFSLSILIMLFIYLFLCINVLHYLKLIDLAFLFKPYFDNFVYILLFNFVLLAVILISNIGLMPIEWLINNYYLKDAKRKIDDLTRLKKIGITGSYGKTSTKYILKEILSEKFNVLMTPASYNTEMGVCKTIRTSLSPTHDFFIVEMGAKKLKDIKKICDIVSPDIGIVTSVGEQHLDTFGSLENIISAKYELIENIKHGGMAFINFDDKIIKEFKIADNVKVVTYGINSEAVDYRATDINVNENGSQFKVVTSSGCEFFETKLLGKCNIYNILSSIAIAAEFEMELKTIANVVKNIKPIPHRLELRVRSGNIKVIDDSFNSNPVGSNMALDVLAEFKTGKKILITPGMIELGANEKGYNAKFIAKAATFCDYIILVGKQQALPMYSELVRLKFPKEKYYMAKNLDEATLVLNSMLREGDVVLFENDLPDTYN